MDEGLTGQALGASYVLLEPIGRGASGEVWRGVDRRTDEAVAAKVLHAEQSSDADLVTRFLRERSVLTGLRDPHLVAVRDLVAEGGRLAIVMDLVEGGSLREVLRDQGPLEPALAVGVTVAVLEGLAAAHQQRLVHRDVKPDNVLLEPQWRDLHEGAVRLTDFGIARIVTEGRSSSTGLLGTPEYMSPELIERGQAEPPTDVYGVGILLYELLAGRTPFAGAPHPFTIARRQVDEQPPHLPVPDPLWSELSALLAKAPTSRPTARAAAEQLRALLPGLAGVPALAPQVAPDSFESARGPETLVRGLDLTAPPEEPETEEEAADRLRFEDLDLGTPGSETLLRPMERVGPVEKRTPRVDPEAETPQPWWRNRTVLAAIGGTLVLAVVVGYVAFGRGGGSSAPAEQPATEASTGGPAQASVAGTALPTGLTVSRAATYDPENAAITLTLTYAAQNAPLTGPFLEVIPGADASDCPPVSWTDGDQSRNLPTVTGIDADCGWSVDPGPLDQQASVTVSATVAEKLTGDDVQSQLQTWLQAEADATDKAVGDTQVTSTAYPVQRLQGIDVDTPDSTVTGKTLRVTLVPVWPNGSDQLHPLYKSPSVGPASSALTAIAGGESGVRFSDACSGGLAVSSDGLVVTTLTVSADCAVAAQVGNFTDLTSSSFTIASRAG